MTRLAASVLLAVELGGGFGTASAIVVSTTQQSMVIEMHVEVDVSVDSVVAHLTLPGDDPITLPMLLRDDGSYGVTTELKTAEYVVVFEAIGSPGARSEPVGLSELGVELGTGDDLSTTTEPDEGRSPATQRWLWLGVGLGAASLSALAFWVLGGREDPDGDHVPDQPSPGESSSDS
jgi:hypothetical protein